MTNCLTAFSEMWDGAIARVKLSVSSSVCIRSVPLAEARVAAEAKARSV